MQRKRKVDRTGRNVGGGQREHWTKMLRSTMEAPAWRALSTSAQALYPWLKLEWKGAEANNNGSIRLSVRQAAERMGVRAGTAALAFHDLQAKGFIVVTELAQLGVSGAAKSPAFEITEIQMPHASQHGGRRLFEQWREGQDFPIQKAAVHNPQGRNGRVEPCHANQDGLVTNTATIPVRLS